MHLGPDSISRCDLFRNWHIAFLYRCCMCGAAHFIIRMYCLKGTPLSLHFIAIGGQWSNRETTTTTATTTAYSDRSTPSITAQNEYCNQCLTCTKVESESSGMRSILFSMHAKDNSFFFCFILWRKRLLLLSVRVFNCMTATWNYARNLPRHDIFGKTLHNSDR